MSAMEVYLASLKIEAYGTVVNPPDAEVQPVEEEEED